MRRVMMYALAREHGVASLILQAPFYRARNMGGVHSMMVAAVEKTELALISLLAPHSAGACSCLRPLSLIITIVIIICFHDYSIS